MEEKVIDLTGKINEKINESFNNFKVAVNTEMLKRIFLEENYMPMDIANIIGKSEEFLDFVEYDFERVGKSGAIIDEIVNSNEIEWKEIVIHQDRLLDSAIDKADESVIKDFSINEEVEACFGNTEFIDAIAYGDIS